MNDLTFTILKIVTSMCAALITLYAVPYINVLRKDAKYGQLISVIECAVRAAEQTIKGTGKGQLKKEKALLIIDGWLNDNKLNNDVSKGVVEELLEACVYQLNQEAR